MALSITSHQRDWLVLVRPRLQPNLRAQSVHQGFLSAPPHTNRCLRDVYRCRGGLRLHPCSRRSHCSKADGLAAGKGVIVASSVDQAEEAARDMLSGTHSVMRVRESLSKNFWMARKQVLLSWSTALMCLRWQRRRTTNELARATPVLTPEAWGLIPQRP